MPLCRDASLVKHSANASELHVLKCRSWTCERCRPDRQKRLYWDCRNGNPNRMLTLTMRPRPGLSPADHAEALVKAWRILRQKLTRLYDLKKIPFIAVFEKHRSGYPHLHILMRVQYIDVRVIRGFMTARLGSPQVNIIHIDNPRQASGYITKYCAKAPTIFGSCKRYWRSQDYTPKTPRPDDDTPEGQTWWEVSSYCIETLLRMASFENHELTYDGETWTIHGVFRC